MAKNHNIDNMNEDQLKGYVSDYYFILKVRDCEKYLDEYKECTSLKGRFHQNFVLGEYTDCSTWKDDFVNCTKYFDKDDLKAGARVVQSEIKRLEKRVKSHVQNDVWTKRSKPPPDWNSKLPDWMAARQNSFATENSFENDTCVIS